MRAHMREMRTPRSRPRAPVDGDQVPVLEDPARTTDLQADLAVHSRREEIEIMKLIGATDWFVRGPFVIEGAFIGVVGAGIAAVAFVIGYSRFGPALNSLVAFLPIQTETGFVANLTLFTVLVGLVVGSVGSFFSVRRHLDS